MKKRMFSLALVMSMLLGMIVMPATAVSADDANALEGACPCGCGSLIEDIQWKVWNVNDDAAITTGHYYLEGDYVQTQQAQINSGNRVVLDLRGYKLTNVADHRMILCYGYMALMDSVGGGRLCGNTTGSGFGGVIMVSTNETMGSVFELYSGTITLDVNHKGSRRGGLITVADTCTFRMYGGTILGALPTVSWKLMPIPRMTVAQFMLPAEALLRFWAARSLAARPIVTVARSIPRAQRF